MLVNYQKDLHHNDMIIEIEKDVDPESYPMRMVLEKKIATLLPGRLHTVNGEKQIYYDISGKQTVTSHFLGKKLKEEEIRSIIEGFVRVILDMQAFLLDVNQLIIDPDYIYYEEEKKLLLFCYLPGYNQDVHQQFRSFLEELLPFIDHGDSQAVVIGYGVYRQSMEDNFTIEQLKEQLYRVQEESRPLPQPEPEPPVLPLEEEPKEEKKAGICWDGILLGLIGGVILLGLCVARSMGYLPFLTFPMLLFVLLLLLAAVGLRIFLTEKKPGKNQRKKKEEIKKEEIKKEEMKKKEMPEIQWPGKQVVEKEKIQQIYGAPESLPMETTQEKRMETTQPLPRIQRPGEGRLIPKEGDFSEISLYREVTLIGKLEEAVDVVIPLSTVSRIHGKIFRKEQEYYLMDLNSLNGTKLNGQQIPTREEMVLKEGDEITFAQVTYVFSMD